MKRLANLFLTLSLVLGMCSFTLLGNDEPYTVEAANENISSSEANKAKQVLRDSLYNKKLPYSEFISNVTLNYNLADVSASLTSPVAIDNYNYDSKATQLTYNQTANYTLSVPTTGYYHIRLDYLTPAKTMANITIDAKIDGESQFDEMATIDLPLLWTDESKTFSRDTYGDETLPTQVRLEKWSSYLLNNNTYVTSDALLFYFVAGEHTITIHNITSSTVLVGDLELQAPTKALSYDVYRDTLPEGKATGRLEIDAISYTEKNSSYVRLGNMRNPAILPYDAVDKKLNIIEGISWQDAGQTITYEVKVTQSGLYNIALHYMNEKNDFSVFRSILIAEKGQQPEILFEDLEAYEFVPTGSATWSNHTLGNENGDFEFYFDQNKTYTLSFRSEIAPLDWAIVNIQLLIDHINQFSLDVRKITGKDIDVQRTWKITKYLPMTKPYLEYYRALIIYMQNELGIYSPVGRNSSSLANLSRATSKLDKMLENPDELPLYLDQLFSGTGSVSQLLGDTMSILQDQPLSLDAIYVYDGGELPRENASWWDSFIDGLNVFIASFTSNKYVMKKDPEAVNVWVNRPITYVDTMQKLADSTFTKNTGIKVKLSVMPDASKLTLATAAKSGPDVALGLASYMPFDLAIRGAVVPLTDFDDFWTEAAQFAPGALIPYVLEDQVYAFPETLDFNATFYRKDILDNLGLEAPNTWDDVLKMVYTLQRYGMNFYHPISGGGAIKWFYQTSGLIYQHGGQLYSDDGLSTAINQPEAVAGLKYLIKLFQTYSLPEQTVSFYNSFRYGDLPIGIGDFTSYITLKTAAPELVGQWKISAPPGIEDANGDIQRWYIANGTSGMIMKATQHKEASWEFLKWWMSTNTQTTFSYNLQSSYGPTYVWLSANIAAVENSNLDAYDKQVILDQVQWLRDVPRTPGQYMLERGLSEIWNSAVFKGTPARVSIDTQIILIERELKRKMIQFNYVDNEGNILKPYVIRDIDWIKEQLALAEEE